MFRSVQAVAIYVTDIERAKGFYCGLLEFDLVVDVTSDLSFLRSRSGKIHVYLAGGCKPGSVTSDATRLSFFLQSDQPANELYDRLRAAKARLLQEAPEQVDEQKLTFQLLDPDGNIIEVVGPVAPTSAGQHQGELLWADRRFDLDAPVEHYRETLERLRGTPARVEDRVSSLKRDHLVRRVSGKWSIQEHAGHLIDVEALFMGRLDDYESGLKTLRPADLSGKKTDDADHNDRSIEDILNQFRNVRSLFVVRIENWNPELLARSAMHPRLNREMRVCDMLHFQAEHDDYHLARIGELIHR